MSAKPPKPSDTKQPSINDLVKTEAPKTKAIDPIARALPNATPETGKVLRAFGAFCQEATTEGRVVGLDPGKTYLVVPVDIKTEVTTPPSAFLAGQVRHTLTLHKTTDL